MSAELKDVGEVIHNTRHGDLLVVMVIKVPRGKLVLTQLTECAPDYIRKEREITQCNMIRSFMQTYG